MPAWRYLNESVDAVLSIGRADLDARSAETESLLEPPGERVLVEQLVRVRLHRKDERRQGSFLNTISAVPRACFASPPGESAYEPVN
jgi:hypothetical protein